MLKKLEFIMTEIIYNLIAILLFAIVTVIFYNVILRYLFSSGIPWSTELARILFVWMVFLGAIIGLKENGHVKVSMLENKLSEKQREILFVFQNVVILLISILFLIGSWQQVLVNISKTTPALEVSSAYFYIPGLISSVGMGLVATKFIIRRKAED